MRERRSWVPVLAALLLLGACRDGTKSREAAGVATVGPSGTVHCKARGSDRTLTLAVIPDADVQIAVEGDDVHVLGYTRGQGRTRFYRVSRGGGELQVVAEQNGTGDRQRFAVAGRAAYYVQGRALFRLGPGKDAASTVREGVHSAVAVSGKHLYAISCDLVEKSDHLLRFRLEGGEPEAIVDLPRANAEDCEYTTLVADERDVFVADWNGSRIWGVSLADRTAKEVVSKKGFPAQLVLEPSELVYSDATGLYRLPRPGGDPVRLVDSKVAESPWSFVGVTSRAFWVIDAAPHRFETHVLRIPRAGGAPQPVMKLMSVELDRVRLQREHDPERILGFAIDDECAYVAQEQDRRTTVRLLVNGVK